MGASEQEESHLTPPPRHAFFGHTLLLWPLFHRLGNSFLDPVWPPAPSFQVHPGGFLYAACVCGVQCKEGQAVYIEAIEFLRNQKPLPPLQRMSTGLSLACRDLAWDTGQVQRPPTLPRSPMGWGWRRDLGRGKNVCTVGGGGGFEPPEGARGGGGLEKGLERQSSCRKTVC